MIISLRVTLLIFSLILIVSVTATLKKGRIPIKYSLLWYFSAVVILVVALFPFIIEFFANILGFVTISNLVIGILIAILLFLTMSLTIITSGQKRKITLLIQEVSLLKEKLGKK